MSISRGWGRLALFLAAMGLIDVGSREEAWADSLSFAASKDNTLFQTVDGSASSGIGDSIICGRVGPFGNGALRRIVIAFDVSAIPAGSTITDASLTLVLLSTVSGDQSVALHPLSADWGEGTSLGGGGMPARSTPNDATWIHRFWPNVLWSNPGGDGDYVVNSSAAILVGATGPYSWTSAGMIADVQGWLDTPASNFGWMVKGNEVDLNSAKRFGSAENKIETDRPVLTVTFTPPGGGCPADIFRDSQVNVNDLLMVISAWGPCPAPCPPYCTADVTVDCQVNVNDLLEVISAWGPCP